jgi:hypothetical protein
MEKTVEIELADGTVEHITLRRILRKERRELNKMIAPKEVSAQNQDFRVEYDKYEEYREKYISMGIKHPEKYKQVAELQSLPDFAFNQLFEAMKELNGENNPEATEKK